jgi:hypothetical protein
MLTALLAAPLLGAASVATTPGAVIVGCTGSTSQWTVTADVQWNGQDVCSARTTGSPIATTFGQSANVTFFWQYHGTNSVNLTDARLGMYFLGFPIVTRDVGPIGRSAGASGQFDMNWAPGELTYAFEGLFRLTATIFAPNGSSAFSENFYVKVTAPADVVAILPIALLALGVYEAYNLAISGRQALLPGRPSLPAPTAPAAPPSTGAGATEPPDPAAQSSSTAPSASDKGGS